LEAVVFDEGRLQGVELAVSFQPFDRDDRHAFLHRRQSHAGEDAAPVDVDGAGSALAAIASLLGSGQRQFITQRIKQRHPRFDHDGASLSIDSDAHRDLPGIVFRSFCRGTSSARHL
jgi:hypothetical protein